jgi:prophage regulatory protein
VFSSALRRKYWKNFPAKKHRHWRRATVTNPDIVDQLRSDPGKRTIGELMQDREAAFHEIIRLRSDIERLRTMRSPRSAAAEKPSVHSQPNAFRSGTLIRLGDVCELVGVCRSTVYRWMSEGTFPEPVRIGEKAVRWRIDDVERWREAL